MELQIQLSFSIIFFLKILLFTARVSNFNFSLLPIFVKFYCSSVSYSSVCLNNFHGCFPSKMVELRSGNKYYMTCKVSKFTSWLFREKPEFTGHCSRRLSNMFQISFSSVIYLISRDILYSLLLLSKIYFSWFVKAVSSIIYQNVLFFVSLFIFTGLFLFPLSCFIHFSFDFYVRNFFKWKLNCPGHTFNSEALRFWLKSDCMIVNVHLCWIIN